MKYFVLEISNLFIKQILYYQVYSMFNEFISVIL